MFYLFLKYTLPLLQIGYRLLLHTSRLIAGNYNITVIITLN